MFQRARRFLFRPAEPSETAPWWDAGGGLLTVLFWACVAVFIAALFRQKFLPFVDYPQHLSVAGLLHRLADPDDPARRVYVTNLASFNSMFHVVVALFAFVMPIERAGEACVGVSFIVWAVAALQLLKVTGRPRSRAFLVMIMLPCSSLAWGFCNFTLSLGIQMIVLARVIKVRTVPDDERLRYELITALLALLGMWAQLLGTVMAYAMMLTVIVADMQARSREESLGVRLTRAFRHGLPLVPALIYVYWSYRSQAGLGKFGLGIGNQDSDYYVLDKVTGFLSRLTGVRADRLDATMAGVAGGVLVLSGLMRDRSRKSVPSAYWLLPAAVLFYLLIPMRLWGTWLVFPRVAVVVVMMGLLFFPYPAPRVQRYFSAIFCAIGLFTAGWFYALLGSHKADFDDLDALLADAPKNRRVIGLIYDTTLPAYAQPVLVHAAAYYLARHGGEVTYSFTRVDTLPVHYTMATKPPDVPGRFEWTPGVYKPTKLYARYFDVVLTRTSKKTDDPRLKIFGPDWATRAKVLSHHGRWWLFDMRDYRDKPQDKPAR